MASGYCLLMFQYCCQAALRGVAVPESGPHGAALFLERLSVSRSNFPYLIAHQHAGPAVFFSVRISALGQGQGD